MRTRCALLSRCPAGRQAPGSVAVCGQDNTGRGGLPTGGGASGAAGGRGLTSRQDGDKAPHVAAFVSPDESGRFASSRAGRASVGGQFRFAREYYVPVGSPAPATTAGAGGRGTARSAGRGAPRAVEGGRQMRIIDLSVPLEEGPSEPLALTVRHQSHAESAAAMAAFFGAGVEDLPNGLGWGNDTATLGSHNGTHVDAPWHYYPTTNGGERARTIDELPLEWFVAPGVVLDMRHKERGALVTSEDLERALARIEYTLRPGDIVMIQTGADKLWGTREYFDAGCGMGRASTLWLINRGIKVMGIDAWGRDRPFWALREEFT